MANQYTDKQRAKALAIYMDHGPAEAARRTGIARGTISQWARRAGVTDTRTQKMTAATEAARLSMQAKRELFREELADAMRDVLARIYEPHQEFVGQSGKEVQYDHAPAGAVRSYATSVGILVDKLRLELGEHTSHDRHESSAVDREIEKLLAEHDRRDPPKVNGNGRRNGHRSPA